MDIHIQIQIIFHNKTKVKIIYRDTNGTLTKWENLRIKFKSFFYMNEKND